MNSSDQDSQALVAWAPQGYGVSPELLAVRIRPGEVTEQMWIEALSDRLGELAMKEGKALAEQAFRVLGVTGVESLIQAGQSLMLYNSELRTNLNLSILDDSPWPATVTEHDPEIQDILDNQTLLDWVDAAWSAMRSG